jgi:ketosteroid isomerase-like protein
METVRARSLAVDTTELEEGNNMHRLLVLAVVVATVATFATGQGGKIEQSLMQMEREWVEAAQKKDGDTLGRILADDWVGQGPTGTVTKAQALAELKSGDSKLESITLGDMKVRAFGDTAVVSGTDDEKSSYKGKDTSGHYTWTDVFVKRQGKWQAVASQSTRITEQ